MAESVCPPFDFNGGRMLKQTCVCVRGERVIKEAHGLLRSSHGQEAGQCRLGKLLPQFSR